MTRALAVITAAGAVVAAVVAAFAVLWLRGELAESRLEVAGLRSAVSTAVDANRQVNATITRLQRSANTTISVTVDWSARNDTLSAVGRDTAVAISEAKHDDPATDALDVPLPDSVSASLGRLYGQACAAASGGHAVSGDSGAAGASVDGPTTPPSPQRHVDRPQAGIVGGRPADGPGQERGR